ncbi:MAG: DUF192 domain-containing protein, partial [Tepidiformaceae bacterium]
MAQLLLLPLLFLAFIASDCGGDDLPRAVGATHAVVTVSAEGRSARVVVEIAATEKQRQQGLMLRQSMDEDAGMLFLFPADTTVGFWMHNTYIPLDIAYIDVSGSVLEIRKAEPLNDTSLTPRGPYRYTLEVNQGWFERHGLGPGARVTLPSGLP